MKNISTCFDEFDEKNEILCDFKINNLIQMAQLASISKTLNFNWEHLKNGHLRVLVPKLDPPFVSFGIFDILRKFSR